MDSVFLRIESRNHTASNRGAVLLRRQSGLGTVQHLYFVLLIDRQHGSMVRPKSLPPRTVQANDFLELGGKLRVVGELELAHPDAAPGRERANEL